VAISAYVFISCHTEALDVVRAVETIPSVKRVQALFGPLDAIAFVEAEDLDSLGHVIDQIIATPGVQSTDTRLTRT